MKTHRVLITSVGGNIGEGIVKALRAGKRSYFIVGVDMEPLSAGFSFVDRHYVLPKTGAHGFEEALIRILKKEKIEGVYVCFPTELSFFSRRQKYLESATRAKIFLNAPEVIRVASDKYETARFLKAHKLPYVETCLAADKQGIQNLVKRFGWPLFAKPRAGFTAQNNFLVDSEEKLTALKKLVPDLIVQRFLPDHDGEFTATTVADRKGTVKACIVLHRYLNQGTTYKTELNTDPKIRAQVMRIAQALNTTSVCNIQFRLEKKQVLAFEVNPRFSGTSGIRYLYGFNDPEMVFEHFVLGLPIKQPKLKQASVFRYWNELYLPGTDFKVLRQNKIKHTAREVTVSGHGRT